MSRHYSPEDRQLALDRLIANHGDIARTAAEFGITARTLYYWKKNANLSVAKLKNLTQISQNEVAPSLPTDDLQAFRNLKDEMLRLTVILTHSIEEAIAEASLGQRITALVQLTDRIVKLAAQLPEEDDVEYYITHDGEQIDDTDR